MCWVEWLGSISADRGLSQATAGREGNLSSVMKSQHCSSEIDVTLTLFSAVICLLALILMHIDRGP